MCQKTLTKTIGKRPENREPVTGWKQGEGHPNDPSLPSRRSERIPGRVSRVSYVSAQDLQESDEWRVKAQFEWYRGYAYKQLVSRFFLGTGFFVLYPVSYSGQLYPVDTARARHFYKT